MVMSNRDKETIKRELVDLLKGQPEVRKLVIFGSFLTSVEPRDIDVAVFQDSSEPYLPLAMKYRKLTRPIARRISMDILPIRRHPEPSWFLDEINRGEVIYER
jgi:predicted nucleotidyltransferase